jgi:hypothetical protein
MSLKMLRDKKKLNIALVVFYIMAIFEIVGIFGLHTYSYMGTGNSFRNKFIFDFGAIVFVIIGALLVVNYVHYHKNNNYLELPRPTRMFNLAAVILACIVISCFVLVIAYFGIITAIFSGATSN